MVLFLLKDSTTQKSPFYDDNYDYIDIDNGDFWVDYPDFGPGVTIVPPTSSTPKSVEGISIIVRPLPEMKIVTWCDVAAFPVGSFAQYIDPNCGRKF